MLLLTLLVENVLETAIAVLFSDFIDVLRGTRRYMAEVEYASIHALTLVHVYGNTEERGIFHICTHV